MFKKNNLIEFRLATKSAMSNKKASGFVAFQFGALMKKGLQVPVFTCKI